MKDEGHGEEYTIDLSDVTNPCSCHQPKWQKLPCVHVIRVLNWREEFWRVWEYAGKEYTIGELEKTCDYFEKEEFDFLVWLHNLGAPEKKKKKTKIFSRSFKASNGRVTSRIPSTGEFSVGVDSHNDE